jgi:hypothetical protein
MGMLTSTAIHMSMATPMSTTTSAATGLIRARASLEEQRLLAPSLIANSSRNARAEIDRRSRWAPARDEFWQLLDPWLEDGARVAVLGAGNGDDLPLGRIAERAGSVTLIDLDVEAARGARRRQRRTLRRRIGIVGHDVTGGVADRVAIAALRGEVPKHSTVTEAPLPGAPYDLAIGDLLYSQLLYPALLDLGVEQRRRKAFLAHCAPGLTRSVVARLHNSAPLVVHVHDPLAWWRGHDQPVQLDQILRIGEGDDISVALSVAARGSGPIESDPRVALEALRIEPAQTALWRWPFARGVDYLACATVAWGGG